MIGNVLNSGMISATATQNGGNTCARALAMNVYGNTMIGNVSNSGTIAAVGTALAGHATVTGLSVSFSTIGAPSSTAARSRRARRVTSVVRSACGSTRRA